jgi:hypothetical protein
MAIHDIEMQPVGTGTLNALGALTEAGVVGSEQRRCDNSFHYLLSHFLKGDFRLFA